MAAALLSSREDLALPKGTVVFGEISLSGHVRPVGQTEARLKEATKLGFSQALLPEGSKVGAVTGLKVQKIPDLTALVGGIFGAG